MKNNKGFTLLELLIVTIIIGIFTAIAIPQFGLYRQKAYYKSAIDTGVTKLPFEEWIKTEIEKKFRPTKKLKETAQDKKLRELMEQNAESRKNRNNESTSSSSNSREYEETKERLSWDNKNTAKW